MIALFTRDDWSLPRSLALLALVGLLATIQFGLLPDGGWQNDVAMVGMVIISALNLWLMRHLLGAGNSEKHNG